MCGDGEQQDNLRFAFKSLLTDLEDSAQARALPYIRFLNNCFWRNEIRYTNALLVLLVWHNFVVNYVAQKQSIDTCIDIVVQPSLFRSICFLLSCVTVESRDSTISLHARTGHNCPRAVAPAPARW